MNPVSLTLFAVGWITVIYLVNCLIAREFKRIDLKQLALYVTTVAMIGVFGEVFLDSVYKFVVGVPLWYYNILPIHHGYTSSYAVVVWGMYGLHLYLLHGSLAAKWSISKTQHLALIISLEALLLEALLTISSKLVFGKYMYYYLPGDLWHVTSVVNFPFYFICGVVILRTLKHFKSEPLSFAKMAVFLTFVLVFLAN